MEVTVESYVNTLLQWGKAYLDVLRNESDPHGIVPGFIKSAQQFLMIPEMYLYHGHERITIIKKDKLEERKAFVIECLKKLANQASLEVKGSVSDFTWELLYGYIKSGKVTGVEGSTVGWPMGILIVQPHEVAAMQLNQLWLNRGQKLAPIMEENEEADDNEEQSSRVASVLHPQPNTGAGGGEEEESLGNGM